MEPVEFGGGESSAPEPQPEQGLKNVFLSEVDPNDRPILEKYVDKWDAGATKKFQEYSQKLKQFEELGTIEQLQQLHKFGLAFNQNPEQVFRAMYDGFQEQYGDSFEQELARILEIEMEQQMSDTNDFSQEPPDQDQVWRGNVENELNEFREWKADQDRQAQEAQESAQLDKVLDAMHNAFLKQNSEDDWDRDYILSRLQVHGNPQQALQDISKLISRYGGQKAAPRQAPMTLGGQGGVPSQQIDAKKLRGNDRKAVIAQLLESNG